MGWLVSFFHSVTLVWLRVALSLFLFIFMPMCRHRITRHRFKFQAPNPLSFGSQIQTQTTHLAFANALIMSPEWYILREQQQQHVKEEKN